MDRKEIINQIVKIEIEKLSKENKEKIVLEWWSIDESDNEYCELPSELQAEIINNDEPLHIPSDAIYTPLIEQALLFSFYGVSNEYLSHRYLELFGYSQEINGEPEILQKCPCCGYRTLRERGDYEICKICFWEDDGLNEIN